MVDEDGPIIADTFYEELFRGPNGKPGFEPDAMKSVQTLHAAVQKLRSENAPFRFLSSTWGSKVAQYALL